MSYSSRDPWNQIDALEDGAPPGAPPGSPPGLPPGSRPARPAPNLRAGAAVTYTLMGLTIAVYGLQFLTQAVFGNDLPVIFGIKTPSLYADGEWWRLITPVFLHGSVLHLGFNMYALYALGPTLEHFYGRVRFLGLYLLAGFAGNVLSLIMTPNPSLGASTAVFGLLAAEGVFLYRNQRFFVGGARAQLINIVVVALINFIIGTSPGIDNWGHLGGFVGGLVFAWFGGPVLGLADGGVVDASRRSQVLLAWIGVFGLAVAALWLWGGVQ
ncbi:MAG: rhomboid family intramembrane serine protease [Caldilineales bacterium]|nr:rhomboid family intramembrane serine protease [Caldilineales bacterium]